MLRRTLLFLTPVLLAACNDAALIEPAGGPTIVEAVVPTTITFEVGGHPCEDVLLDGQTIQGATFDGGGWMPLWGQYPHELGICTDLITLPSPTIGVYLWDQDFEVGASTVHEVSFAQPTDLFSVWYFNKAPMTLRAYNAADELLEEVPTDTSEYVRNSEGNYGEMTWRQLTVVQPGITRVALTTSNAHTAIDNMTFLVSTNEVYTFTGFFQPVDNGEVFNKATAGSSIPVKFSLGDDYGLDVLAANSPSSAAIDCGSNPIVDPIEEITFSSSGLHYSGDYYTYVWKTEKSWAGTCRRFTLGLNDGQLKTALFQFK